MLGGTNYTDEQKSVIPRVAWPRVETEPRSGRKILSVGIHACEMEGLTTVEARMLLMDLLEHAIQREFVYQHHWQVGDLVMWDNRRHAQARWVDFGERRGS